MLKFKLSGFVELDETYVGGNPRYHPGLVNKRGRGKRKVLSDDLRPAPRPREGSAVTNEKISALRSSVNATVYKDTWIISNAHHSHKSIAVGFAGHQRVINGQLAYARGSVHVNTAELFVAMLWLVKEVFFKCICGKHFDRYLQEISFRWNHHIPMERKTKAGNRESTWKPMPVSNGLQSVLSGAIGKQKHRALNNGLAFCY